MKCQMVINGYKQKVSHSLYCIDYKMWGEEVVVPQGPEERKRGLYVLN